MIVDWNKVIESVSTIYTDWINAEPIDYWKDLKLHELHTLKKNKTLRILHLKKGSKSNESNTIKKDRNRTNRTPIKKAESDRCDTIKKQQNATQ